MPTLEERLANLETRTTDLLDAVQGRETNINTQVTQKLSEIDDVFARTNGNEHLQNRLLDRGRFLTLAPSANANGYNFIDLEFIARYASLLTPQTEDVAVGGSMSNHANGAITTIVQKFLYGVPKEQKTGIIKEWIDYVDSMNISPKRVYWDHGTEFYVAQVTAPANGGDYAITTHNGNDYVMCTAFGGLASAVPIQKKQNGPIVEQTFVAWVKVNSGEIFFDGVDINGNILTINANNGWICVSLGAWGGLRGYFISHIRYKKSQSVDFYILLPAILDGDHRGLIHFAPIV